MAPHFRHAAAALALACASVPVGTLAQSAVPALPPPASLAQASPEPAGTVTPSPSARRRWELVGMAGYQLNTDVGTTTGSLSVGDTPVYGAILGTEVLPGTWAELMWLYSNPTVQATGVGLNGSQPLDVATHYFQIGGTKGIQRGRVNLFGGATVGAVMFVPGTLHYAGGTSTSLGTTWRFAFTVGGGARVDLSPNVALRFDARIAAPIYFSGGGFYAGTGGAGLAVGAGIPFWEFNFLGALALMF